MLNLSSLKPKIKRRPRKRVGRGSGSGQGTYAGRGIKGQKARTGGSIRPGFEGGRMPLIRQLPKARGFKSFHSKPQIVSLEKVVKVFAEGSLVTSKALLSKGLIKVASLPVKILGGGAVSKKLEFRPEIAFSRSAKAALEKAGGKVLDV